MEKKSSTTSFIIALILIIVSIIMAVWGFISLFRWLTSLKSDLAVGLITASSTIIVATLTLVLGRYFERSKEAETHLRSQKIEMYDDFLKEFFAIFYEKSTKKNDNIDTAEGDDTQNNEDLTSFLQEWQRKLIVWAGPTVLLSYVNWKNNLTSHPNNARTLFLMEDFFKAMRKDIGLSNRKLEQGIFSYLILRNAARFLAEVKSNPNLTFGEFAEIEENEGL